MNSLPQFCAELGLPVPPEGGDKRDRLHAAFDMLPDEGVAKFAAGLVAQRKIGGGLRDQVQDVLWSDLPLIEIPKRSRRDIARALNTTTLFRHFPSFEQLLRDVFVIDDGIDQLFGAFLSGRNEGVVGYVQRHFVRNPEDADVEELFNKLNALDLPHRRFGMFLEGLVCADVQVDVEAQERLVSLINPVLQSCGAELRQMGEDGGYPTFVLVGSGSPRGRPKNIIFASQRKPDIRFRDAVNNDIEIASNADDVLVYDRPLTAEGLRWADLQKWWAEETSQPDADQAKRSLYKRLKMSLPASSPPPASTVSKFLQGIRCGDSRTSRASSRGLAALGFQDRLSARCAGIAKSPHGLLDADAWRRSRSYRSRREAALRGRGRSS